MLGHMPVCTLQLSKLQGCTLRSAHALKPSHQHSNLSECVPAGAVVTGSHCDAIPHAGLYDGTLGVIGAIAAVKGLRDAGFKPERSIEVLFFTSEEPTRFGFGCIGR